MNVDLGIFARVFPRDSASGVAGAVASAGFHVTQLNLSSMGHPTLPPAGLELDLGAIRDAFRSNHVQIWGLSATYNTVHPDTSRRLEDTVKAKALIARSGELGAHFVTLCTGTRDPQDMWRRHPDNGTEESWRDLRATLDMLLPVAEAAGVRLGIEPESANVVADAARAARLIAELGADARLIGIVLDPANLVTISRISEQEAILQAAFEALGNDVVALHAKDVAAGGGYAAAGIGQLDYDLIFELYARLPSPVPIIIQDAEEADVPRTRDFLVGHACMRA